MRRQYLGVALILLAVIGIAAGAEIAWANSQGCSGNSYIHIGPTGNATLVCGLTCPPTFQCDQVWAPKPGGGATAVCLCRKANPEGGWIITYHVDDRCGTNMDVTPGPGGVGLATAQCVDIACPSHTCVPEESPAPGGGTQIQCFCQ